MIYARKLNLTLPTQLLKLLKFALFNSQDQAFADNYLGYRNSAALLIINTFHRHHFFILT